MSIVQYRVFQNEHTLGSNQSRKDTEYPNHPPQASILTSWNAEIEGIGNNSFTIDNQSRPLSTILEDQCWVHHGHKGQANGGCIELA